MGAIVFADEAKRRQLEAVIHPRVGARALEIAAAAGTDDVVVHDIPLLVETGQEANFDAAIVVDVPEEVQVERMISTRPMTAADAPARSAAQATRWPRRARAPPTNHNTD